MHCRHQLHERHLRDVNSFLAKTVLRNHADYCLSFVYGGYGWRFGDDSIQYDTVNVLTLPAFHWFSIPYPPQYPRFAHSCNAVGGSQIISVGGLDARAKNDLPGPANEYNNSADQFLQGLAIFDMTTMNFADQFTAAAPPYEQSDVVKQYYGQAQQ